jgi:YHS domain-containing protein
MKVYQWVGLTALLGLMVLAGCQDSGTNPPKAAAVKGAKETEAQASLAELAPEDRPLAEAQRLCPVTGEALGEMGTPIKVDIKGQTVFLCCEGCKKKALGNPDKTLASVQKLKSAPSGN